MFDWQGIHRHSSPAGMQNPKFCLSCVHCVIQISQILLSCVHCVIQNAHFELKFKIRTLPLCENILYTVIKKVISKGDEAKNINLDVKE